MKKQDEFNRDRDVAFRALTDAAFDGFQHKWALPRPTVWQPGVRLGIMHKLRLQLSSFTPEEKAASRAWLAANNMDEVIGGPMPCPGCGSTTGRPTISNCATCGIA